jgi:hypothetical protein
MLKNKFKEKHYHVNCHVTKIALKKSIKQTA